MEMIIIQRNYKAKKASFDEYVLKIIKYLTTWYRCTIIPPHTNNPESMTDGITIKFTEIPYELFLSNWFLQRVREDRSSYVSAAKLVAKDVWENVREKLLTPVLYKPYLHEPLLKEIGTRHKKPFEDVMNRL